MVQPSATDASGLPTEIRLTNDPRAPVYGRLDPNTTHPYRQTELIDEVNHRLPVGVSINAHDILCARRAHKITAATHPDFAYQPAYGSQQYSAAFADWLAAEYARDDTFFDAARDQYAGRT